MFMSKNPEVNNFLRGNQYLGFHYYIAWGTETKFLLDYAFAKTNILQSYYFFYEQSYEIIFKMVSVNNFVGKNMYWNVWPEVVLKNYAHWREFSDSSRILNLQLWSMLLWHFYTFYTSTRHLSRQIRWFHVLLTYLKYCNVASETKKRKQTTIMDITLRQTFFTYKDNLAETNKMWLWIKLL